MGNQLTHIEKIYNFLVSSNCRDKRTFIYSCLCEYPIKGKIPSFFSRVPIFHNNFFDMGCVFKSTNIEGYMNLSEIYEIAVVDFILSRMKATKSNMGCEIKYSSMEDILVDFKVSKEEVAEVLKKLSQSNLTIETSQGVVSFPIFSSVRWNIDYDGVCNFIISDEIAAMYLLDNLVEYRDLKKITNMGRDLSFVGNISNTTVSDLVTTYRFLTYLIREDKPIQLSFILENISPTILKPISKRALLAMIKKDKNSPIVKMMKNLKIGFDPDNSSFYASESFVSPQKNAMFVEDILSSKPIDQYIVFEELELDSKLINKAIELKIPEDKIEIEFSIFKEKYKNYKNKYKKSSASSTWANYIRLQFKSGLFKEYEENAENAGNPETIIYNDAMRKQSELHKVSKEWVDINFEEFKRYYIAKNISRKNWVLAWNSWVERGKHKPVMENKENKGLPENITMTKEIIEAAISIGYPEDKIKNEFFRFKEYFKSEGRQKVNWVSAWKVWVSNSLERIKGTYRPSDLSNKEVMYFIVRKKVSDALSSALVQKGVSLSDIVRGVFNIKGITWERVTPPAGQGKNPVNIFKYLDAEIQKRAEEAISSGLGVGEQRSEKKEPIKEEEIIDGEIIVN